MRKRVQRAVMVAVVIALAVFVLPLGLGATALLGAAAGQETERVALEAAFRIGPTFTAGDPVELPPSSDATVGLYSPSGSRVSGAGPARLENASLRALSGVIVQTDAVGSTVAAVPVTANEGIIGVVRASRTNTAAAASAGVWVALLGIAAVIVAGSALLARRAAAQLADPVERLAGTAREMGEGRLLVPARSSGIEEVDAAHAALVDAGARIADLVGREQRIASNASHQLRTPLAGLRVGLELALADPGADQATVLAGALAQVDRLDATIDGLIALARTPGSAHGSCDPVPVLEERVAHWRTLFERVRRDLALSVDGDRRIVAAPPIAIATTLDVLLENALRHGTGRVEVVARLQDGVVAVEVIDGGPYRGPDDPFPDGASGDGGSGLGLGLARRTAQDFGGRLLLAETAPRTRFELLVPTTEEATPAGTAVDGTAGEARDAASLT
ncbi:MAG TPA: HAMP domain-containing sensor histidine kinase [Amnibacterium sp.]|jgi:signal transduction histidine kinase|nr:HAMP domain-containing sensor histidine kinase [Amnibacterium sp.]